MSASSSGFSSRFVVISQSVDIISVLGLNFPAPQFTITYGGYGLESRKGDDVIPSALWTSQARLAHVHVEQELDSGASVLLLSSPEAAFVRPCLRSLLDVESPDIDILAASEASPFGKPRPSADFLYFRPTGPAKQFLRALTVPAMLGELPLQRQLDIELYFPVTVETQKRDCFGLSGGCTVLLHKKSRAAIMLLPQSVVSVAGHYIRVARDGSPAATMPFFVGIDALVPPMQPIQRMWPSHIHDQLLHIDLAHLAQRLDSEIELLHKSRAEALRVREYSAPQLLLDNGKKSVYFVHVPKAAGSSLTISMRQYEGCLPYGHCCMADDLPLGVASTAERSALTDTPRQSCNETRGCAAISGCTGHVPTPAHLRSSAFFSVLTVRDPLARAASAFRWPTHHAGHELWDAFASDPTFHHVLLRMLVGHQDYGDYAYVPSDMYCALRHLAQFDAIAVTEAYTESVAALGMALEGRPWQPTARSFQSKEPFSPSATDRGLFLRFNRPDTLLYMAALRLFCTQPHIEQAALQICQF